MCAPGLGWPWLRHCRGAQSLPREGTPREVPPKGQKIRDQIKPQSSSKEGWIHGGTWTCLGLDDPGGLFQLQWFYEFIYSALPFTTSGCLVKISSLLAQQHLGKGSLLPHLHCTLSIIWAAEYLDELEQETAGAGKLLLWFLCFFWKAGAPHREMALGVIWDSGSDSKQNVCAAFNQISQIQGAGWLISTLLMMQDVSV